MNDDILSNAFDAMYQYMQEINDHNIAFLNNLGPTAMTDFANMTEGCSVGKIEFTDKSVGNPQHEDHGVFCHIHVDQRSVGDSGDSFTGTISARVGKKWIIVNYEM